jgi:hypothetical protein
MKRPETNAIATSHLYGTPAKIFPIPYPRFPGCGPGEHWLPNDFVGRRPTERLVGGNSRMTIVLESGEVNAWRRTRYEFFVEKSGYAKTG